MIYHRPKRTLYSKKYGVDLIRYTHAANTVVYSSNKIDGMLLRSPFFSPGLSLIILMVSSQLQTDLSGHCTHCGLR